MSSISSQVPASLSQYLSNTKNDSKKLMSAIESLYNEKDDDNATDAAEKFVKYYNNIIKDNNIYNDQGLKKFTKEIKSIVEEKSSSLSSWGITIEDNGTLKLDKSKFETATSNYDFKDFVSENTDRGGIFYDIKKLVTKLKKDNTYYLSDKTKKVINNAVDTYV